MSVIEANANNNPCPNHRFISDPVNTNDVSKVLGRSSLDVGALCSSGSYINRWAKFKPVKWGYLSSLAQWNSAKAAGISGWSASESKWFGSKDGTGTWVLPTTIPAEERNKGVWWVSTALNCGISVTYFTSVVDMCNNWLGKSGYSWHDYWSYASPNVNDNDKFRLTDFAGYCHFHVGGEDFDKPVANFLMDSTQTQYRISQSEWAIGGQAIIQKRLYNNTYLLSLEDISVPDGASLSGLDNMYFAIAIIHNYDVSANRQYAFTSSYYKFNQDGGDYNTEHSSGRDLRMTQTFSMKTFEAVDNKYMVFPFLSSRRFLEGSGGISDPWQMYSRTANGSGDFTGIFIPLPYYGRQITVERKENNYEIILSVTSATASSITLSIQVKNVSDAQGTVVWNNIAYTQDCYPLDATGNTNYADGVHVDENRLPDTWGSVTLNEGATSAAKSLQLTPARSSSTGYWVMFSFHAVDVWDIGDAAINYLYKV